MKKLLLLGDSIRMNYQPSVVRHLNGKVQICAPQDNARFARYTLWYIREWLGTYGTPDIVHWNNGMWDIYRHDTDGDVFTTDIKDYMLSIEKIYDLISGCGAKVVFATTTAVRENNPHAKNVDIDRYNAAALSILAHKDVFINDLNSLVRKDTEKYVCDDLMHLSPAGIELCGNRVAQVVESFL